MVDTFVKTKQHWQNELDKMNRTLGKGELQGSGDKVPYYATGARCFIKMGGKALAVCQDFRWNIAFNATPIQTVDTVLPWDIDVGQITINATLSKIYDPLKGPEVDNLFSIMAAAVHQPMVELQVIYKADDLSVKAGAGNSPSSQNTTSAIKGDVTEFSMFFARGMFTSINGNSTLGQVSNLSAAFTGVAYQHYVSQGFTPYGVAYAAQEAIGKVGDIISSYSGGFL